MADIIGTTRSLVYYRSNDGRFFNLCDDAKHRCFISWGKGIVGPNRTARLILKFITGDSLISVTHAQSFAAQVLSHYPYINIDTQKIIPFTMTVESIHSWLNSKGCSP